MRAYRLRNAGLVMLLLAQAPGCAFDVSHVNRVPAVLEPASDSRAGWMLQDDVTAYLGTGFPTRLRKATRWSKVGQIAQGDVFRTRDQVVTVEASNIYEAMAVLNDGTLVGFYLPVEHSFVAAQPAILNRSPETGG